MLRKPVGSELRLSFLQTIIQSKALMVRPDEQFVRYAEIKTFEKLTGTKVFQQIVRGDIPEIKISLDCKQMQDFGNQCTGSSTEHLQSPDFRDKMPRLDTNSSEQYKRTYIKRALRRTVESLFPSKYTDQHRLAYTLPSASANYNFTRKEFGALGHLLPIAQRLNVRPNHSLISFAKVEKYRVDYGYSRSEEMIVDDENKYEVDVRELTKRVYEFRKQVFQEALEEIPYAVPLGLSEPSKVRVITKGPPATYAILKPLQKFMHNQMRKIPQLALMGKEVDKTIINGMFKIIHGNELMLSGDYSDATNELKMWVSEATTDAVIDVLGLGDYEATLVRKSLTEHVMRLYSPPEDRKSKPRFTEAKQTEGQLMGSILSFIWLCIVNLTLMWITKENNDDEIIELRDLQCLVNGDDCLIALNKHGKRAWEIFGQLMGLKPSVGKVFYTNEFCTLNSRMFYKDERGEWTDVPFISSSLLSGKEKSVRLGTEKFIDPTQKINDIGQRNYWLMYSCPIKMRQEVQKLFIKNNEALLKNPLLYAIDWFMPTWSGGLGMCDVADNGWVYNIDDFPGNPERSYDDDLKPTSEWKIFCDERDNDEKRKKSRGALFHMLTNWNKKKFRPIPWTQPRLADNLNMIEIINQRMPSKPKEEVVSYLQPEVDDNINESLFGLLAMDVYLTDTRTHDIISQKYEKAINDDYLFPFIIKEDEIVRINKKGEEEKVATRTPVPENASAKRKAAALQELFQEKFQDEHVKRIKFNRSVWQSNISRGCTTLASYEKIQNRKYRKVFRGRIIGKGAQFIQDVYEFGRYDFDYVWDQDAIYGKNATLTIQEW